MTWHSHIPPNAPGKLLAGNIHSKLKRAGYWRRYCDSSQETRSHLQESAQIYVSPVPRQLLHLGNDFLLCPLPPTNSSQFQVTLEHEGIRSHRHRGQHRSWRRHGGIRGGATAWGWNEGDASQEAQGLRWKTNPGVGVFGGGLEVFLEKKPLEKKLWWVENLLFTKKSSRRLELGEESFPLYLDVFGSDGHFMLA